MKNSRPPIFNDENNDKFLFEDDILDSEDLDLDLEEDNEEDGQPLYQEREFNPSITISARELKRGLPHTVRFLTEIREELRQLEAFRPKTRSDCQNSARPCPWVSCKYNLYLDVNSETGSLKLNFPGHDLSELDETCALDVAEKGGVTLEEIGYLMHLERERIRQIEGEALDKIMEPLSKIMDDPNFRKIDRILKKEDSTNVQVAKKDNKKRAKVEDGLNFSLED